MRKTLRVASLAGVGLSSLLLLASAVLWVRSLGHREGWIIDRVETPPDCGGDSGRRIAHHRVIAIIHGRLWTQSYTSDASPLQASYARYTREPFSASRAEEHFREWFPESQRTDKDGFISRSWRFAGLGWSRPLPRIAAPDAPQRTGFLLAIPFWMPALLFSLWPAVVFPRWIKRWLGRRRFAAGLCPQCGYDLRATPDRCPECGRRVGPS